MTRPPQHELFASERPVRSDYARERSYALRRFITVTVLAALIGGGIYAMWGRGATNLADIPTIHAEGAYKQKPADPGGIDIPHQDVRVYDQLENKTAAPPVEHLLPPPEVPQEVPHAAASVSAAPPATPAAAPPLSVPASADILTGQAVKAVATTVAPTVASALVAAIPATPAPTSDATAAPQSLAPAAPLAQPQSTTIDQVIANTKAAPNANSGNVVVQLASVPDQHKAQVMAKTLQAKYAATLGDAVLRPVRADLGSKGIYYRIQSQGLADGEANHICSSLKQMNAGCILVRP